MWDVHGPLCYVWRMFSLCPVWVPRNTLRSVIRLGSKLLYPPSRLASPEGDIFNNCLIRLENVSFCFRKNQVVRGDIFNHFLAVNLDQMSAEPAALQQLAPRTVCHSASSFRVPATYKQHQQQWHKVFWRIPHIFQSLSILSFILGTPCQSVSLLSFQTLTFLLKVDVWHIIRNQFYQRLFGGMLSFRPTVIYCKNKGVSQTVWRPEHFGFSQTSLPSSAFKTWTYLQISLGLVWKWL